MINSWVDYNINDLKYTHRIAKELKYIQVLTTRLTFYFLFKEQLDKSKLTQVINLQESALLSMFKVEKPEGPKDFLKT